LFLVLVLPTVKEAASISNSRPEIAGDWYYSINWLGTNSNATNYYDNPDKTPEYSVLSWWDYGNWILYQAKRPVVVSNFQNKTAIEDATKFYLSDDELTATDVLDDRGVRYVITECNMLYGKLPAIASWANQDPSAYITIRDLGSYKTASPTGKLFHTTLARLHLFDGSGMGRLRLIYESRTIEGGNPATSEVKIFEYLPGAVIKVSTAPGMKVGAMLKMVSNQGRMFYYATEGKQEADGYEIRVPYSTEKRYDTHAVAPYLVTAGNSTGNTRTKKINVTEEDVLRGRVIDINLQ
jgi:asparagine N-glycosylation enzyme membrane subunit Stt3